MHNSGLAIGLGLITFGCLMACAMLENYDGKMTGAAKLRLFSYCVLLHTGLITLALNGPVHWGWLALAAANVGIALLYISATRIVLRLGDYEAVFMADTITFDMAFGYIIDAAVLIVGIGVLMLSFIL